jgi:hypothetical protein
MAALVVGAVVLVPALRADDGAQTRAVRLSSVEGQVRIAQGGQVLADPALQNTPLFEGTQVSTAEDGRAELQFDDGSVVRLSPNSSLALTVLRGRGESGDAEIALTSGLIYFELRGGDAAKPIRIRFDDCLVTAGGVTVLRINLDNTPGELAVFSGNAHLERGSTMAVDLHGGESVSLNGHDPSQYNLAESIEPDSWDAWNSDRDQTLMSAETARTGVANNLPDKNNPAWNDLDANGNWYNVPDQGYVWSPNEAASPGWDPYGNGYWMWTPRFGYIWVSGDSWGYMPYQCGAWNYFSDFGWGWAPGGCSPWWGGGIWISNVGFAPGGYRPPIRPPRPPLSPRPRPVGPIRGGGAPHPPIIVNRRPLSGAGLTARNRTDNVTIGGHMVQPLRPVMQRPLYDGSISGNIGGHSQPVYSGSRTPVVQRPAFGSVPGVSRPGSAVPARPSNQHAPAYSRPSSGSHPAASHPSSSGGGGSHAASSGGGSHR